MDRKKRIKIILSENFKNWNIKVQDVSFQHKGHNNFTGHEETHFLIILKPQFNEKIKRIDIHKKINLLLSNEFKSGLHALEIKIKN